MSLRSFRFLATILLLLSLSATCAAQTIFPANPTRFLVCNKGDGRFEGKLPEGTSGAGITVSVGAAKQGNGFAAHACQAKFTWRRHELVVTPQAAQADIDVMGADFGLGSLVVAFQIKAENDPHIHYEIYSLSNPPRLLRTITGEDFFSAADTMSDGSVEIWTTDAAAVDGIEGLPLAAFAAPTVVLRFEKRKLIDVSSQFRPFFDGRIATLRAQLNAEQLTRFRQSDGRLSSQPWTPDHPAAGLLATKINVLELVWCYLYSGREQDAWGALAEMWPRADLDRIHAAMAAMQSRGLRSQVDGVSHNALPFRQSQRAEIYEGVGPSGSGIVTEDPAFHSIVPNPPSSHAERADTAPLQILLRIPPPRGGESWDEGKRMELVIDEAGKVRSARIMVPLTVSILDKSPVPESADNSALDKYWLTATAGWKYIPAYKLGHPKPFRLSLVAQRDR